MKIKKLALDSFGKFQNFTIDLDDGFNVIYGHNESGKSTVMAFIMMMFYGYSGRKPSVSENPRTKYQPWNGQKMSGKVYFESEGVDYRLERSFGKSNKTDKIKVYQEHTGEEVQIKSSPGNHFFHVNEDTFRQSLFIFTNQTVITSPDNKKDEITERLMNLVTTGSEDTSYDSAIQEIGEAKQRVLSKRKKKGKLFDAQQTVSQLKEELMHAYEDEKDKEKIQSKITQLESDARAILVEKDELEKSLENRQLADQAEILSQAIEGQQKILELSDQIDTLSSQLRTEEGPIEKNLLLSYQDLIGEIESLQKEEENIQAEIQSLNERVAELESEKREEIPPGLTQEMKSNEETLASLKKKMEKTNKVLEEAVRYQKEADKEEKLERQYQEKKAEIDILQAEVQKMEEKCEVQRTQVEEEQEARLILAGDLEAFESRKRSLEEYIQEEENEFNYQTQSLQDRRQSKLDHLNSLKGFMNQKTSDPQSPKNQLLISGLILAVAGIGLGLLNPLLYLLTVLGVILVILAYRQEKPYQKVDHADLQAQVTQLEEEIASGDEEYKHQQGAYEQKAEENRQLLASLEEDIQQVQQDYEEASRIVEAGQEELKSFEKTLQESENNLKSHIHTLTYLEEELASVREEHKTYPDAVKEIDTGKEKDRLQEMQEEADRLTQRKDEVLSQYGVEDLYDLTRLENDIQTLKKTLAECQVDLEKRIQRQQVIQTQVEDKTSELFSQLSMFEPTGSLEAAQALVNELDNQREQLSNLLAQAQMLEANQSDLEKSYSLAELQDLRSDIEKQLENVDLTSDTTEELEEELGQINDRLHEIDKEISKTETEVIERYRGKANVSQIRSQLAYHEEKERKWQQVYDDLERAEKYLEEAFGEMQTGFSPIVNEKTSENFSKLTGGKYSEVKVSKDFDVSIEDHETQDLQLWEYMSTGTIDQIYLSLRLAISEIIAEEEGQLPLFLDDVFAQYDDGRAKNGLTMLAELSEQKGDHQILLFTCHQRIADWGAEIEGVTVNRQLIESQ